MQIFWKLVQGRTTFHYQFWASPARPVSLIMGINVKKNQQTQCLIHTDNYVSCFSANNIVAHSTYTCTYIYFNGTLNLEGCTNYLIIICRLYKCRGGGILSVEIWVIPMLCHDDFVSIERLGMFRIYSHVCSLHRGSQECGVTGVQRNSPSRSQQWGRIWR